MPVASQTSLYTAEDQWNDLVGVAKSPPPPEEAPAPAAEPAAAPPAESYYDPAQDTQGQQQESAPAPVSPPPAPAPLAQDTQVAQTSAPESIAPAASTYYGGDDTSLTSIPNSTQIKTSYPASGAPASVSNVTSPPPPFSSASTDTYQSSVTNFTDGNGRTGFVPATPEPAYAGPDLSRDTQALQRQPGKRGTTSPQVAGEQTYRPRPRGADASGMASAAPLSFEDRGRRDDQAVFSGQDPEGVAIGQGAYGTIKAQQRDPAAYFSPGNTQGATDAANAPVVPAKVNTTRAPSNVDAYYAEAPETAGMMRRYVAGVEPGIGAPAYQREGGYLDTLERKLPATTMASDYNPDNLWDRVKGQDYSREKDASAKAELNNMDSVGPVFSSPQGGTGTSDYYARVSGGLQPEGEPEHDPRYWAQEHGWDVGPPLPDVLDNVVQDFKAASADSSVFGQDVNTFPGLDRARALADAYYNQPTYGETEGQGGGVVPTNPDDLRGILPPDPSALKDAVGQWFTDRTDTEADRQRIIDAKDRLTSAATTFAGEHAPKGTPGLPGQSSGGGGGVVPTGVMMDTGDILPTNDRRVNPGVENLPTVVKVEGKQLRPLKASGTTLEAINRRMAAGDLSTQTAWLTDAEFTAMGYPEEFRSQMVTNATPDANGNPVDANGKPVAANWLIIDQAEANKLSGVGSGVGSSPSTASKSPATTGTAGGGTAAGGTVDANVAAGGSSGTGGSNTGSSYYETGGSGYGGGYSGGGGRSGGSGGGSGYYAPEGFGSGSGGDSWAEDPIFSAFFEVLDRSNPEFAAKIRSMFQQSGRGGHGFGSSGSSRSSRRGSSRSKFRRSSSSGRSRSGNSSFGSGRNTTNDGTRSNRGTTDRTSSDTRSSDGSKSSGSTPPPSRTKTTRRSGK